MTTFSTFREARESAIERSKHFPCFVVELGEDSLCLQVWNEAQIADPTTSGWFRVHTGYNNGVEME